MTNIEKVAQEVRLREEDLRRYRQMVKEVDEPRVADCRREFERAKRMLEDAEKSLEMGQRLVRAEEFKLNAVYAEYYKVSSEHMS